MTIRLKGSLVKATSKDLEYLLVPYGEEGRTSVGRVTCQPGVLKTVPASALHMNVDHDRSRPAATCTKIWSTDAGIKARFKPVANTAGRDLVAEPAAGVRPAISVEIDNPVIRAGQLIAGVITGAAAVVRGAFPAARLTAADAGDLDRQDEALVDGVEATVEAATTDLTLAEVEDIQSIVEAVVELGEEDEDLEPNETDISGGPLPDQGATMTATATATATPTPNRPARLTAARLSAPSGVQDFATRLAAAYRERFMTGSTRMLAALSQSTVHNTTGSIPSQWLGELWVQMPYQRRYIDLFQSGTIDSDRVGGWKWDAAPEVDQWEGFPEEVPSGPVVSSYIEEEPIRFAGGWEIDRQREDFSNPEFWAGFYREAAASYARKTDYYALNSTIRSSWGWADLGTVPEGISTAAAMLVDGALALLDQIDQLPTWALVPSSLYRDLLLVQKDQSLEFLSQAFGFAGGSVENLKVIPFNPVTADGYDRSGGEPLGADYSRMTLGTSAAATWFEFPGPSPIRVETIDVSIGGVQKGVYSYARWFQNSAKAAVQIDAPTPPPPVEP